MTERTDYEDARRARIESAIRNHWEVCKGTHGGNDGWFKCEAS